MHHFFVKKKNYDDFFVINHNTNKIYKLPCEVVYEINESIIHTLRPILWSVSVIWSWIFSNMGRLLILILSVLSAITTSRYKIIIFSRLYIMSPVDFLLGALKSWLHLFCKNSAHQYCDSFLYEHHLWSELSSQWYKVIIENKLTIDSILFSMPCNLVIILVIGLQAQ